KYLVLASRGPSKKNLAVWELSTGKIMRFFERDPNKPNMVISLFFLPGTNQFVTLGESLITWNLFQQKPVSSSQLNSHTNISPNPSVVTPDGKCLLWAAANKLENIQLKTGKTLWTIEKARVSQITLLPGGKEALVRQSLWDEQSSRDREIWKL